MSIANNIKVRRRELGYTLEEIAKRLGTSRQTVHRYETGVISNIPSDKVELLADVLDVTPSYLMGWDDLLPKTTITNGNLAAEQKDVPAVSSVVDGKLCFEKQNIKMCVQAGHRLNVDFAITADDDSMTGAFIRAGDTVFVKKQGLVDQGEIAVVLIDDKIELKRYYKYGDTVVLRPENSSYSDIVINTRQGTKFRIIGKAVAFQSEAR